MEATAFERKLSELDCPFEIEFHTRGCKEGRMKEWIHPSQRTPEGKQAFEDALEEVRRYTAASEAEATQAVYDALLPRVRNALASECVGEGGLKHYGVWHPKHGWTWAYGIVFSTTNWAIAEAQCDVCWHMGMTDANLWEVRCIEEWYEAQGC